MQYGAKCWQFGRLCDHKAHYKVDYFLQTHYNMDHFIPTHYNVGHFVPPHCNVDHVVPTHYKKDHFVHSWTCRILHLARMQGRRNRVWGRSPTNCESWKNHSDTPISSDTTERLRKVSLLFLLLMVFIVDYYVWLCQRAELVRWCSDPVNLEGLHQGCQKAEKLCCSLGI